MKVFTGIISGPVVFAMVCLFVLSLKLEVVLQDHDSTFVVPVAPHSSYFVSTRYSTTDETHESPKVIMHARVIRITS